MYEVGGDEAHSSVADAEPPHLRCPTWLGTDITQRAFCLKDKTVGRCADRQVAHGECGGSAIESCGEHHGLVEISKNRHEGSQVGWRDARGQNLKVVLQ